MIENSTANKITLKTLLFKYKYFIVGIICFSILSNGLNLFIPRLIGEAVDKAITSNNLHLDSNFVFLIISVCIGGFAFAMLELFISTYFSEKFARDTRLETFKNLTNQPYQFVIKEGTSNLITVFGSDIDNIETNLTNSVSYIFQSFFLLLGALILMLTTSWKLSLVAILSLPIIIICFGLIFGKIGKLFQKSQENLTQLNGTLSENINGAMLIRVLSAFNFEKSKYLRDSSESRNLSIAIVKSFSFLLPATTLITNIVTIIFLYYGGRLTTNGELSVGQLTAFISYFALLIAPIFILGFSSQGISQALNSWKRIEPILNANFQSQEGEYVQDIIKGDLEVKNLTLEFGGKKVLDSVNFKIPAGSKTAIIGPTGAGKSQLLNILIGLSQPNTGEVILDGQNIQNWNRSKLLNRLGIVFQESLIFNTSFHKNIKLDRELTQIEIEKAIETADLQNYVIDNQAHINSKIDEKGANLSGGQKQRLTLARALAGSPDLLLLDDFTARVDSETENRIKQSINSNYPNTQIIQVTQKISAIQDYDNIIVIMEGQILGQGTHTELMQSTPEYKQIFESQQLVN